ncbi:MAG: nickel insertion protein, partial [Actinomycetota bacterium]
PRGVGIERLVQLDTNVDDLDPRVLPHVIDRLLDIGAVDAWITPIVMKKGRAAFTVSALAAQEYADAVRDVLFLETSTIGIRTTEVERHSLDRRTSVVHVDGHAIAVKLAERDGTVVNRSVEWDDVAGVAAATGRPAKDVLAAAAALARELS